MNTKQEEALREYLKEAIVPLIEQVLVKKLGQAMSFAASELVQPQRKPLTDEEIMNIAKVSCIGISPHEDTLNFAKVIEAVHGIKE